MNTIKKNVLVTQVRYKQSISIMKSLSSAGYGIHGADSMRFPSGRFSRYCDRFTQCRCPKKEPEKFIEDVISISKKNNIEFIVPGFSEILVLSKYIDRIHQAGLKCLLDESCKMENANNKSWVMKKAEEIGIPIPATWHPKTIMEVKHIADNHTGAVIIKALSGKGGEGLKVVDNINDLVTEYQVQSAGLALDDWPIIQELVDGQWTGAGYLFDKGKLVAEQSYIVTRTLNNSIPIDRLSKHYPELLAAGRKLLVDMQWNGVAQLDFLIEHGTGRPCLLEINPRFWASLGNATHSGVDFPKLVMCLNEQKGSQPDMEDTFRAGVRTIWFFPYMVSLLGYVKKLDWREVKEHFYNPFAKNLSFDDISTIDPLPGLVEPFLGLYFLLKNGSLRQD
jgi:predicted ATP-grasp superfamily ATP-dependent carboligase